ncbi:hypothetical protein NPIL_530761 [Nephila pilipes]|uniref:Uncharacterized protein n=1 Tax=Nephila pilipes TaxID=299642 RepID=A0A8X6U0Y5_NEPPI|nr:hypothetical protein NPIL_530761 [Nephila pilipes]
MLKRNPRLVALLRTSSFNGNQKKKIRGSEVRSSDLIVTQSADRLTQMRFKVIGTSERRCYRCLDDFVPFLQYP